MKKLNTIFLLAITSSLPVGLMTSLAACANEPVPIYTLTWDERTQGNFVYDSSIMSYVSRDQEFDHNEATDIYYEQIAKEPKILANDIMYDFMYCRSHIIDSTETWMAYLNGCDKSDFDNLSAKIDIYKIDKVNHRITIRAHMDYFTNGKQDRYFDMYIENTPFSMHTGPFSRMWANKIGRFDDINDKWCFAPTPVIDAWYGMPNRFEVYNQWFYSPTLIVTGYRNIDNYNMRWLFSLPRDRGDYYDTDYCDSHSVEYDAKMNPTVAQNTPMWTHPNPVIQNYFYSLWVRFPMFCSSPFLKNVLSNEKEETPIITI